MKILLVYPEYPDTFWSFKYALKFVSKKAAYPPLGLITVASLLPDHWETKLVDMNIEKLHSSDLIWADYVFLSAMNTQILSAITVIARCNHLNIPVVAGGPLFTADYKKFGNVDHLVLNEAEITLPLFLKDLENGHPKHLYQTEAFACMKESPIPDYSLIKLNKYTSQSIQFSRGCPFNCEFCDITALLGHQCRLKPTQQVITELQNLYDQNFRGSVFFVDDNFIGNKKRIKKQLLPAIISWMQQHNYPFHFTTEASINLSDDEELMDLMTRAGFLSVFIGIETPEEMSLNECNKVQNKNRNLIDSVKKVQKAGMEVLGGFIIGFDSDTPNIFQRQIQFIQESGIISAMVGLLNAPTKSQLYKRLKSEGRILDNWDGDNTSSSMNFIPKMDSEKLRNGFNQVIRGIYGGKAFYERVKNFLKDFEPKVKSKNKMNATKLKAFFRSVFIIGILDRDRKYYWKLFFWSLIHRRDMFPMAITYAVYGYHFKRSYTKIF
ncbi:B12-binding domain-containing radical SAM protein [uncultured Draconibacterium sp.]|uniref:B12-binding domain-containing radical SAM protein n=1 Tax=uncultured Draconibacterium sp. TaxID=1573823 RepID=UPI0029C82BCB|nr:B12-binding domain-containing radical SAM protein [uncultured Draconibacterium sp.]